MLYSFVCVCYVYVLVKQSDADVMNKWRMYENDDAMAIMLNHMPTP